MGRKSWLFSTYQEDRWKREKFRAMLANSMTKGSEQDLNTGTCEIRMLESYRTM
jgi:hypothetical protein